MSGGVSLQKVDISTNYYPTSYKSVHKHFEYGNVHENCPKAWRAPSGWRGTGLQADLSEDLRHSKGEGAQKRVKDARLSGATCRDEAQHVTLSSHPF